MERIYQIDKQPEGTAKPTGQTIKASTPRWLLEKYTYQESPKDDKGSSHCDPRLELVQHTHGQHQDSNFIPSDDDPEYIHRAFGSVTPQLDASDSFASDQGTLAGGNRRHICYSQRRSGYSSEHHIVPKPIKERALDLRGNRKSDSQVHYER